MKKKMGKGVEETELGVNGAMYIDIVYLAKVISLSYLFFNSCTISQHDEIRSAWSISYNAKHYGQTYNR